MHIGRTMTYAYDAYMWGIFTSIEIKWAIQHNSLVSSIATDASMVQNRT